MEQVGLLGQRFVRLYAHGLQFRVIERLHDHIETILNDALEQPKPLPARWV